MATHVAVLPVDVLDTLSRKLNERSEDHSTRARFLRLPHPRTGIASLFLPYERRTKDDSQAAYMSIAEVQAVATPNARSWFMGDQEVVADGKLIILTPVDPVFLLIPLLQAAHPEKFCPIDDIFEEAAAKLCKPQESQATPKDQSTAISEEDILYLTSLGCINAAMQHVCDVKEITPEITVYRFSSLKLVQYLREKVARLSNPEVFEYSRTLTRGLAKDGLMEDGKEDLLEAGRTRAACDLVSQYTPPTIRAPLLASYDLTKLDEYLKSMQHEIAALAEANTNGKNTKKNKGAENQEKDGDGKKRKSSSKSSQGVEKLKKTSTTGMAKLSTFFKKSIS